MNLNERNVYKKWNSVATCSTHRIRKNVSSITIIDTFDFFLTKDIDQPRIIHAVINQL